MPAAVNEFAHTRQAYTAKLAQSINVDAIAPTQVRFVLLGPRSMRTDPKLCTSVSVLFRHNVGLRVICWSSPMDVPLLKLSTSLYFTSSYALYVVIAATCNRACVASHDVRNRALSSSFSP